MYEMLTGLLPYDGNTVEEITEQHQQFCMVLPHELNTDIPIRLEEIMVKAIASGQNVRYQSADELLDDLEAFRKEQSIGLFDTLYFHSVLDFLATHSIQ